MVEENIFLDIGGGVTPKEGYTNIDILPCADIVLDVTKEDLPFADNTVSKVHSSHAFEHFSYGKILKEICRVCKTGSEVVIRVPHWNSDMAFCAGHVHSVSETQVKHWSEDFVSYWFDGSKRLKLIGTSYVPNGKVYDEAKECFPNLSPLQIKKFIPNTCTEIKFLFEVIPYAR